jgi:transcriptional regulator with XRE-family HTH domain
MDSNFGEKLKDLRKLQGLTLLDVAELTGLSEKTIRHIESNKLSVSLENWIKVGKALGLKFDLVSNLQ